MPLAMSSAGLTFLLGGYCVGCLVLMYFCMLAEPVPGSLAEKLQITLPHKLWQSGARLVGTEKMQFLQHFMDKFMVLMYFVVVGGSWSVVFWCLYPWLLYDSNQWKGHAVIGVLVFLLCFVSWGVANKSHPGRITAKNFGRYDHYPYDGLLFPPHRRCETTHLPKVPRSKFDRIKYNCIVPRYDHFCGWTYNTYGEENYRYFLGFLAQHVLMCFYGSYVCYLLFADEIQQRKLMELTFFDRATGETVQASRWIIFQYMFARRTFECCVFIIMAVMGVALAAFLGYHIYLTTVGQTTNENAKWGDIKSWHKRQLAKYKQAIKDGKITPPKDAAESVGRAPTVAEEEDDGDVTCTGTGSGTASAQQDHPDYFDPGPMPKNLYDCGWKENWREVIFPMSKRKDALALSGYTKRLKPPPQNKNSSNATPTPADQDVGKPKAT